MTGTGSGKNLAILIILCSISATVFGVNLWLRYHRPRPVPVVFATPTSHPARENRLQITVPELNIAEYSKQVIREGPATPSRETGRPDPFAKLPEEEVQSPTELPAPPEKILNLLRNYQPQTAPGLPEPPRPAVSVRGIIMGKQTAAFIEETGKPGYRRVRTGDPVSGGKLVEIGESGVVIEYQGKKVSYSLGE